MNVEVNEKFKAKERDFPKLMKGMNGRLVLMTGLKKGIALTEGSNKLISKGSYCDDWNMSHFTDFEGSITLSNE